MIQGIQITKSTNNNLVNSIWLLDTDKNEARCVAAEQGYEADQVVSVNELGEYESRELGIETDKPIVKIEGGQHLYSW